MVVDVFLCAVHITLCKGYCLLIYLLYIYSFCLGKKLKTKTAGKLKTKDKTFKSKQKAKVRTMKKQPKAKLTQALETDVKLVKPIELEKPVFNSEDKMVFTKFDFSSLGSEKENSKKSETPKKLLKRISDQKEKVHKLEADDKMDQAKLLKEKSTWQTALKKIRGVKVKDDPELLRKTIRRDQQMKKQSEKKWKDRQRKVKQDISDQQKTRNDNIAKKKDQRKQFVKKKAIKRGRIVPGF